MHETITHYTLLFEYIPVSFSHVLNAVYARLATIFTKILLNIFTSFPFKTISQTIVHYFVQVYINNGS